MTARVSVVVTGIGVKSPAGLDLEESVETLIAAKPCATTLPALADGGSAVDFGCPVPEFDEEQYLAARERRKMDRSALLALVAAVDAMKQAGLSGAVAQERLGVAVGTGVAGIPEAAGVGSRFGVVSNAISAFTVPSIMANSPAARISMQVGATGSCLTYATACASGATAIGESLLKIRGGQLDAVVAGGTDAALVPVVMSAFHRIGALSTRRDDPASASRPFDDARDGFVMGEGATMLVLERREHAIARGARILGEVLGYGTNADAYHIVAPQPDGRAAADCIRLALRDAGLEASEVQHINAHGTSTVQNDRAEALAIRSVFGAGGPPVAATKGVTGHLIGAAGAFEAAVALTTSVTGIVPQVANFAGGGDADIIDLVHSQPRSVPRGPAVSNSFGFGGHNTSLVLAPA